jgi:DNA-binding CsgD family transcriptional regulator
MNAPLTQRTDTGYQIGHLHATGLTPRQSQVLLLRAQGKSVRECAQLLNCSMNNVKQILTELFFKLEVNNTPALIMRAFESLHLQFLSIFAAVFIALFASISPDTANNAARVSRAPRTQFSRSVARPQRNSSNNKFTIKEFS